jgi:hypothetical protein
VTETNFTHLEGQRRAKRKTIGLKKSSESTIPSQIATFDTKSE